MACTAALKHQRLATIDDQYQNVFPVSTWGELFLIQHPKSKLQVKASSEW